MRRSCGGGDGFSCKLQKINQQGRKGVVEIAVVSLLEESNSY